ncbi:MAG: hypothetical protein ACYTAO_02420 [Planctomycetota bacterium]
MPSVCTFACATAATATSFIVIWQIILHINFPVDFIVDETGKIHIIPWAEQWHFLTECGCKAPVPSPFGTNPHNHLTGKKRLPGSFDPDIPAVWGAVSGEFRGAGALSPGTIVMLQEISDFLRPPIIPPR